MEPKKHGYQMYCYASGNGAIHFVWKNIITNNCDVPSPTMEECQKWFEHSEEGKSFKEKCWRLARIHHKPVLVADITRINDDFLLVRNEDGHRVYWFTIVPWSNFPNDIVPSEVKAKTVVDGMEMEVKNQNTLAAIAFFLNNEEHLSRQIEVVDTVKH